MNILNTLCLASVIVVLVFIQQAFSIKCWDCRSDIDPKCADPFDNTTFAITDCSTRKLEHLPGVRATMCRKMRQKVNGVWKYVRSCAFLGEPGIGGDERFCLMRTGTYNIFMEYCTCNTKDGCNTSSKMLFSPLLLVLIFAVLNGFR
ncbi:uncharacterized protein LOC123316630 [Coccinella septempunctata]|uniref:uncharacterized protein LOC123316630 n=1 Tax=Coccinella septempunctata TaxID=41139 RepID=UPI001D080C83|nr:uncharacterized protein LOC123316630 [Coccinella septempunctata]